MEDVDLSKNGKTRAIVEFRAISKSRSAIGKSSKIFKGSQDVLVGVLDLVEHIKKTGSRGNFYGSINHIFQWRMDIVG